ncbi:phosphonate C-P lyase system protein PhnG [Roseibium sp.]|uniref:phosphonate C-P lyase system protein PhnG n=1 Tax=Roseibium sp. TaxID=1936156 RepID=UPI003A973F51
MSDQSMDTDQTSAVPVSQARRKSNMAVLAEATPQAIAEKLTLLGDLPAHDVIRVPETGLVMVRGRTGGTGSPFNLGEVTVTRCVVRLASGETGSSYIVGRHKQHAHDAALIDALWQHPELTETVEASVISPLKSDQQGHRQQVAEETAATRVDFFTMVRGDD